MLTTQEAPKTPQEASQEGPKMPKTLIFIVFSMFSGVARICFLRSKLDWTELTELTGLNWSHLLGGRFIFGGRGRNQ